jgi:hypothetical protein
MSCALRESKPETMHDLGHATPGDPQAELYSELANGLHAMVQPLTIVRGALGALSLSQAVPPEQARYLEMSSAQIDRMCELMSSLQSLLEASQYQADCVTVSIWELIEPILEEIGPVLEQSGVRIVADKPAKPQEPMFAIADPARTESAFRAALKTVASVASRGDVVQVYILPRNGFVDATIQIANRHGKNLSSAHRLSLALAQANIRSQQGVYECIEDPLCISLKLPLQDKEEMSIGPVYQYFPVEQLS